MRLEVAEKLTKTETRKRLKELGWGRYCEGNIWFSGPGAVFAYNKGLRQWIGVVEDEAIKGWNDRLWEANTRLVRACEAAGK